MAYDDGKDWSGDIRSAVDGERYERERADSDLKSDIRDLERGLDATKDELREARSEITELSSTVADLQRRLAALEAVAKE